MQGSRAGAATAPEDRVTIATDAPRDPAASSGGGAWDRCRRAGARLLGRLRAATDRRLRLRHLLFLALLCASAIPALIVAVSIDHAIPDVEFAAARDKHLVLARNLALALSRYARDVTAVFRYLVTRHAQADREAGMPDLLASLDFRYICIFDEQAATVHLWTAPDVPRSILPTPELKRMLRERALAGKGEPVMTDFVINGGVPLLFLVQTLDDHAFAAAAIGTGYFSELRKAVTFGRRGHAAILDHTGHIIAHPDHNWELTLKDLSALAPVAAMMRGETGVTTFFSPSVKADMITGYAAVPEVGWGVMVPQPVSEIHARADAARAVALGFAAAGLVLAAVISWWLARRLTAPIGAVVATAGRIAAGQRSERVPPLPSRTPRELRRLAEAFNQMLDELEAAARQLAATEADLRQSQKLEALGRLTGGIAHDFNNMLTVISGNLELLERRCAGVPGATRIARAASIGAFRAQKLTQHLLAYARKQSLELRALDINQVVAEIGELAKVIVGERIELRIATDSAIDLAISDRGQLETALINLVMNARDAIAGSGTICIGTGSARLDPEDVAELGEQTEPGKYVTVTIADTGAGMTQEVREKAIEPFFTTKGVGKGTGLGLSMVYGFMRQSGGYLTIDSAPGRGTSIRLYFKAAAAESHAEAGDGAAGADDEPSLPEAQDAKDKRVLIVEDDDNVREFAASVLREVGYSVLEAAHARSGLDLLMEEEEVDVVLSDVVMPGPMTGADLARAALSRRAAPAVILTTGYANVQSADWPAEQVTFLPKPFRVSELVKAVETALRSAPRKRDQDEAAAR